MLKKFFAQDIPVVRGTGSLGQKVLTCSTSYKLNILSYQLILLSLAINCGMQACSHILKDIIRVSYLNVLGDHFFIRLTFMINV